MPVIYSQNFDSLNNGELAGQDGWTGSGWIVQESMKFLGAKAIQAGSTGNVERTFSGTNNEIHWIKFVLSSSLATQVFPGVYVGKSLSAHASIVGMLSSYIQAFDGNGSGSGSWVSTGVLASDDEWYVIKKMINHSTKKWDIYVSNAGGSGGMDTPKLSDLGFRYNESDSLNWLRLFQNTIYLKYIDELWINTYDPDAVKPLPITNKFHSVEESGGFLQ